MSLKNWFLVHIPPPEYMSMLHAGVDISPVSVHVIEFVKKNRHLHLGKFGVHQLPTVVDRSQPLVQNEGLIEKLKEIKKIYGLTYVELSIPEELAYLFTTLLPYGDEETIRNHIELHLEENVPISLADAVFDYHMIEEQANEPAEPVQPPANAKADKKEDFGVVETKELQASTKQRTFLASVSVVPKSIIDQYIEAFELAGMTPVSFLIENQALSKSIIKRGDNAPRLMVHVGEKKSVISVISKGSVQFTSTVLIGSEDFTLAIMKEYGVSREDAIRMKTERGFIGGSASGDSQGSIFLSLINTASALKDEIDRIVLYWQSYVDKRPDMKGGKLASVVLSGRDALISGFKEYLSATVRLPVNIANVWSNIYDIEKTIPEIEYIDSLDYASAIGLALPNLDDID